MYKAHSKDINRNKSFHPLTFGNLRKVEKLKEKAAVEEQIHNERTVELTRDQEKRRYDELILNSSLSAGGAAGDQIQGIGLAHSSQVYKVFAAEYERESESTKQQGELNLPAEQVFSSAHEPRGMKKTGQGNFLSKFKQDIDTEQKVGVEALLTSTEQGHESDKKIMDRKRCRDDGYPSTNEPSAHTGFVTSSEVCEIKKQRNLVQKQRMDPQLRVLAYQNRTLTEAARLKDQQSKLVKNGKECLGNSDEGSGANYGVSKERNAIEERIRSILMMKKAR